MTQLLPIADPDAPPESREHKVPSSRGGLRLLCRLGQGGMAEVHLAARSHFSGAPDLVVIKRMHQQHVDDPATVRMFLDEAHLALRLVHPNIVRTERLGTFGGRHGIVMEFLEGQPFHQVLKRAYAVDGSLHLDLIAQVAIAALDGLHYAHELKDAEGKELRIVHRDVSPQNLFVTYDGAVKLLDFGIAKNAMQDGRTRTGLLKGKIAYMAPEQARGEATDRRADIWSLGVTLWEAVTGSRLFKGTNEAATLNMTLTEEVKPPSQRGADLPPELEAILMRALERDPSKRYATAAAMRDDLEAWLTSRAFSSAGSLPLLMHRLFGKELAEQREQISNLLRSPPEAGAYNEVTRASSLFPGGTGSGLRATQMSNVTDLMQELTRQRRTTTRLLTALIAVVTVAAACALYLMSVRAARTTVNVAAGAAPPLASLAAAERSDARTSPKVEPSSPGSVVPTPGRGSRLAAPAAPTLPARVTTRAPAASEPRWRPVARRSTPVAEPDAGADAAPAATGLLNFDTTPWSLVSVGGRTLGQTPLVGASLPAGTHTLVLHNPELGLRTTYSITIAAGKTTARRIGLD